LEEIPILDQIPNYVQLINLNDLKILLEKFLEKFYLLINKLNYYYEQIIDHHPALKEIYHLHSDICFIKEQIQNVINKLFIQENCFPNDQFIGELAKNFIQIFQLFCQIDFINEDKDKINFNTETSPLRRYTKRLLSALTDLSSIDSTSPMWLVHFYNYFNSHITQLNLPALIKLIPKSMTSKSEIFFHQIHLLIEQLLYRFVYYHYCTSAMYLSLSKTFLNLLRDGFQMPSDEEKKNNEQQKSEGGPSGMGEGEIEKDAKDVSDQIETEDQLDEAKMPGQEENTDEQQNVDEEASGIEVSFDFEAPMEDPTQG
jgi:hypothetical protein